MSNQGARRNGPVKLRLTGEEPLEGRKEGHLLPLPPPQRALWGNAEASGARGAGLPGCRARLWGTALAPSKETEKKGGGRGEERERGGDSIIYLFLWWRGENACCDIM